MAKRIASIVLVLVLLVSLFPNFPITAKAASTLSETQFANKIAALKQEYPDGKYWSNKNGTVQSGTYKGTSLAGDAKCSTSYYWSSNCGTLVLSGTTTAWQCHGFALLLGHKIFGSNANNWSKYTSKSRKIYAGDVLRIDTDGDGINDDYDHTIFVYRVTSTHIYYVDCNKTNPCQINWDGEMTLTSLSNKLLYVRHLTDNTLTGSGTDTPVLSVKYNANGGTIPNTDITGYTYKVTESTGVNMRKGAGTSYDVVTTLTKGTTFSVNVGDTKTANGYTWGKTTVGSKTGWVVISDFVSKTATLRASSYYLSSSLVYKSSSSAVLVHEMTYGETSANGLYNTSTFGLTREGYTFTGWSLSTEGDTVIDQNQALTPEEIVPELKDGSKTVTLYAIWEENTPASIALSFDANGGSGTMDTTNATKGDSITLPETLFTKENHSFIGWTVQRDDGLWYTSANTWSDESTIAAQGNTKKILSNGETIVLDSTFVTASGNHGYTLYAEWKNDSIQSIQVASIGKEEIYYVGDTLNTGNISLLVSYVDGSFEIVTEGLSCTPTTLSNEGTETITVSYGSLSTTYTVQVTKAKTSKSNGTGKADNKGYLLPSTSAGTIAGQGVWKSDSVHVLCKDGNFYLTFIPWGATSVTSSNRVLLYLPTSAVTVSGTIPSAAEYYSMNPTGENNATVNSKVYAYHRTDGGATAVKYNNVAYTTMGPLAAGDRVKVLFEMDGCYCVQTSTYTGFVAKSAITLDAVLCGIYVDSPTTDFCLTAEKGKEIDTSSLTVAGNYSDGTNQIVTGYEIDLPDTATTGLKYATIRYGGFTTFVPVQITSPVITGISVNTNPIKVKYTPDEQLDLTGLKINVEYEDGNVEIVSQGFTAKTEDFSDTGYTAIAIEYMGFETHIAVFVYDPIQVKTQSVDGYIGQTVSVPVTFNCTSDDVEVYSFLASFSYDSSKMEYRGFTSEGVLDATRLIVNPDSNNKIVVAYASDTHIPADSTMLEFQFNIIDEAMETNHYTVSIDECTMYDYASEPFVLNTENGSVNNLGLVTANYEVGEGTNAPEQIQVKYGVQITVSDQIPSREGFEFAGWALSADATTADYNAGDTIDCLSNITLYAIWDKVSVIVNGVCGENLSWRFDDNGELAIIGTGAMKNYAYLADVPWSAYSGLIKQVIISVGVTTVGDFAFANCTSLQTVIYGGTQAQWAAITVGEGNEALANANVLYIGEVKLSNAAPTLYDNIAMNYKADKTRFDELGITDPYLVVSFNGNETTLTDYTVSEDGAQYVFTFFDIAPNQMDDTLTATLYATYGDDVYEGATLEYSVATYCYRMLNNSTVVNNDAYAELRTLLVDLLHYGAMAQKFTGFTGETVDARLTEAQLAWGTTATPTLESKTNAKYATVTTPTAAWASVGLVLEDAVTMRFKFTADSIDGISVKITSDTNPEGWIISEDGFQYEESTGRYYVDFGGLHAGQMRESVYVTVYDGDTAVSNTLRYTVESYAQKYQAADETTYPNLAELVKAMMRYGDAAYNFAN